MTTWEKAEIVDNTRTVDVSDSSIQASLSFTPGAEKFTLLLTIAGDQRKVETITIDLEDSTLTTQEKADFKRVSRRRTGCIRGSAAHPSGAESSPSVHHDLSLDAQATGYRGLIGSPHLASRLQTG